LEAQESVEQTIRAFLAPQLGRPDIAADEDLFLGGFVNSLLAMQLIVMLEKSFAIRIDDDDLDITNFSSIARMVDFVERKNA
jgi:methoxymalonate biosynthesis acyl carrier protein